MNPLLSVMSRLLQPSKLQSLWCAKPDSNWYGLRRGILSPLCLPLSPSAHKGTKSFTTCPLKTYFKSCLDSYSKLCLKLDRNQVNREFPDSIGQQGRVRRYRATSYFWSLMQDSNLRPFVPKTNALPDCANQRFTKWIR